MTIEIPHNKPTIGREEIDTVTSLLKNSELTLGKKVNEFEDKFSDYIGLHCAAVSSGTAALHLALLSLGVSKGDEVILPSYTCPSVAMPILYLNGIPVFGDIGPDYNISSVEIIKRITDRTKAVIVPHMFGYPADIIEIKKICHSHKIPLIEDCAQSIGAAYDKKNIGTFGDVSIFSFNSTKMITSIQGGMVCSNNTDLIEGIKEIRYPDQESSNCDRKVKYSYMISDISAAVGIIQLGKLKTFVEKRKMIANIYRRSLKNVIHPRVDNNKVHVFSRYVVMSKKEPEKIIDKMKKKKIDCRRMHFPPLHWREVFAYNGKISLRKTEEASKYSLSLPIFPSLKENEAYKVSDEFNRIIENRFRLRR